MREITVKKVDLLNATAILAGIDVPMIREGNDDEHN